jgi:hypothetical protein
LHWRAVTPWASFLTLLSLISLSVKWRYYLFHRLLGEISEIMNLNLFMYLKYPIHYLAYGEMGPIHIYIFYICIHTTNIYVYICILCACICVER